jgi:hypothetical protein
MNRKIVKYLKNKEITQYTALDNIFITYINGDLKELLNNYGFTKIEFFPKLSKGDKHFQIYFIYFNLRVIIEFRDLWFEYCIYAPYDSVDLIDKCIIRSNYNDDFNIETFINYLNTTINKDNRLKKY